MPQDNLLQKNKTTLTGFQKPNEIITPNQFFDVVLPYHSTPVIRVVGYILQQTLGYTNDDGDPFQERFCFSQKQIAREAGVAPSSIKRALDQAVEARFLKQTKQAVASAKGKASQSAEYELRWHEYADNAYIVDPRRFEGFFANEGNRTYIPTEFFTHVLRFNTKSVIRFVGAVIRNTIGIKASHGKGRKKRANLSYRKLQAYLKLSSTALAVAIKKAIERNYVVRLAEGVFDPRNPENNRDAVYTVKWCQPDAHRLSTPKTLAKTHTKNTSETTPKSGAAIHTKNLGQGKPFPNGNDYKQQADVVVGDLSPTAELLVTQGFRAQEAQRLASSHDSEVIARQVAWLPQRAPKNPLGMLKRAIENDWSEPVSRETSFSPETIAFAKGFYAGRWESESSASDPSTRDLRVAERIVNALTKLHGGSDPTVSHQWGTRLGRRYGRDFPKLIPSLAYAGSVLADDFIAWHRDRLKFETAQRPLAQPTPPTAPPSNDKQDREAWLDYLASQEPGLRTEFPEAFAAFEKARSLQKQNFDKTGMPNFARQMRAMMDSREIYLADLQKAFPSQLPSLEAWPSHPASLETLST